MGKKPKTFFTPLRFLATCLLLVLLAVVAYGLTAFSGINSGYVRVTRSLSPDAETATPVAGWEHDRRVTQNATGAGQDECFIGVNPHDINNAIVVTKDYRSNLHDYIDTTTDGGATWLEQPFPDTGAGAPYSIDPQVFFRGDGRAYLAWTAYIDFPDGGVFVAWSDDKGITWSPAITITQPSGRYDDKPWLVFDETDGSHNGNIYAFWTHFGNAEMQASTSTDNGTTWSVPLTISTGKYEHDNDGAQPVILSDGTVLVVFMNSSSQDNTGTYLLSRSTDGGATYSTNVPVQTVIKPPFRQPGEIWRLFTYESMVRDPVRGWLTMIWGDYRDGETNGIDILLSRSTDDGVTWSAPTRLNDDPAGLVRDQWFPVITAAPDGRLTAIWLDRRDDPSNRYYYTYARTSTDGGLTWQPSVRISSFSSDPNLNIPDGADGIGDYIGLSSEQGVVWAAWVDVRNGDQDIYAARAQFPAIPTPTATPIPTITAIPTITPVPTSTPCVITFTDVPLDAYFYEPVRYLYCRAIISGYSDNTFRPYNTNTRGQLAKIISLAESWSLIDPPQATFADVPPDSTFYTNIETAYAHSILSGYPCGAIDEPCDLQNRPYFRPGATVTRGQTVKLIMLAQGYSLLDPATATYADVPPGSTFYRYIETATAQGIINGYPCGNPEPCDPQNRPYFRPGNSTLRGQIAKIVYNALAAMKSPR